MADCRVFKKSFRKTLGQMNACSNSKRHSAPCLKSQKQFTKRLPFMNSHYKKYKILNWRGAIALFLL